MKLRLICGMGLLAVASAYAGGADRFIRGHADAQAQIVVTNEETGAVMGYVAAYDGSYRAPPLNPGRYTIVERGEHHAVRHLTIDTERDGQVDLAAGH